MSDELKILAEDRRGYEVVNLGALRRNMEALRQSLPEKMNIIVVVKANAYGLGAIPVSETVNDLCWGFAVATFKEGRELREAGFTKPILILGPISAENFAEAVELELRPVLFTEREGLLFREAAQKAGKTGKFHIAVDTGMSRIGVFPDESGKETVRKLTSLSGVQAEGIFTHLATIDCPDKSAALLQEKKFVRFLKELESEGITFALRHCANSVASITENAFSEETILNGCRYGICLYGDFPKEEKTDCRISVEPVASLYSEVTYMKTLQAGTAIGYGGTFVCPKETKIATVAFGYADGYPRGLSNKGFVLISGKRYPIVGRVCMDQFMVDVTEGPDVKPGDKVTLLGKDGEEEITLTDMDRWSGRFSYEFLCDISARVSRYYEK